MKLDSFAYTALVVAATSFRAAAEPYLSNCYDVDFYINGSNTEIILEAVCEPDHKLTWININNCYMNNRGALVAKRDGNFGLTCKECEMFHPREKLHCICHTGPKAGREGYFIQAITQVVSKIWRG